MAKDLVVPSNYIIDESCISLMKDNICGRMLERQKNKENENFDIYIENNHFRIIYNHHIYKTTIVKENDNYYWYLIPYNKSYFTTSAKDYNSFDLVVFAIQEHDKLYKKNH